jgi:5-methylcytosine-specific restriction endonuclease McrA
MTHCCVEGCDKKSRARGMCDMHYRRVRRAEAPEINKAARDRWAAKNPDYNRNRYLANKDERRKAHKAWAANNKDKLRAYYRSYWAANKDKERIYKENRRARKREAGTYTITKREVIRLYNSPCVYCGSSRQIHMDHVIPLVRGGRHSIGNIVPACQRCNCEKHAKLVIEWKLWKKRQNY